MDSRIYGCSTSKQWTTSIQRNCKTSDRFAQLIGNGLLVLIDKKISYNNLFNSNEIISYRNLKDLTNKIEMYANNDKLRQKIAKNGRNKYFKYFNSTVVAEYIINKTFNIKKKYYWEDKG